MTTAFVSDETIRETTLDIIVDELELDAEPDEVDGAADLIEFYGADSLGLIQVLARVNKQLGIRVPREQAVDLRTVELLVQRIIDIRDGKGGDQ
ncbi:MULTISPECIES: acyl carrier protein [Streptomyces]|uniref:Acyl carrier protein n=1 Tax=Streptomyces camelliae TaxID=3004093 RepID=A0ABY7P8L9_9ACTN|nr:MULTISPECIES: acyl carrier protein [unclassified Streptomyces]WBO66269.1 acyl carrier protein [Streptomyces sp. HUAS 2-6]